MIQKHFKDIPIRHKLTLLIMATVSITLILAAIAFRLLCHPGKT